MNPPASRSAAKAAGEISACRSSLSQTGRVITRCAKIIRPLPNRRAAAPAITLSLPAPLEPTTRISVPRSVIASGQRFTPANNRKAKLAGNPVDGRDGGEDHQHDERDAVEIVGTDLLRELQPNAARTDDADDRRRARVRFEEI